MPIRDIAPKQDAAPKKHGGERGRRWTVIYSLASGMVLAAHNGMNSHDPKYGELVLDGIDEDKVDSYLDGTWIVKDGELRRQKREVA